MGTVRFHQAQAAKCLQRADRAIAHHDPPQAAVSLRQAVTHGLTAVAVRAGLRYHSRRQLEAALSAFIARDRLSRDHLNTFRQIHSFPDYLSSRDRCADPAVALRRMRRRVSWFIRCCDALIAGQPKPVRMHKRWRRDPDFRKVERFDTVQDILSLPNYSAIQRRFHLSNVPLSALPDPHDWYRHGLTPRPCSCHPDLWDLPKDETEITLSPPWRRALEKTFWIKLPEPLRLRV